ncbi:MAG: membrane protein insertase YidC [Alphaproteobacteria bacterium]|nr:membrane protein insertase YidC [Alphaproteobacteria bacterium]
MDNNRNTILAFTLSAVILVSWQYFFGLPVIKKQKLKNETMQTVTVQRPSYSDGQAGAPPPLSGTGYQKENVDGQLKVKIETSNLGGSINLRDGRIDHIFFKKYRTTIDPESKNIALFSPEGTEDPYFSRTGWKNPTSIHSKLPNEQTIWKVKQNQTLTPSTPVTLFYDNGEGLIFRRKFSIDNEYMITISDEIENKGETTVSVYPYSMIRRYGTPTINGNYLLHEGIVGVLGEKEGVKKISYEDIQDVLPLEISSKRGWLGITDKYWSAVLIPDQNAPYRATISSFQNSGDFIYQTSFLYDKKEIRPKATTQTTTWLFTGAKEVDVISQYKKTAEIYKFDLLIDWGLFYFITKPLFFIMDFFYKLAGNFGLSILIVTVLIKLLLFPLAYKSYAAMSRMKILQPELLKIRDQYQDDHKRQQQEMIKFYKEKKINPAAGCLPMIAQIPFFFALYKVLFITIEMRHAPFFGWIKDLAAPDPQNIFNLFGLIPWDPSTLPFIGSIMVIGIWPILMGITMFVQMRLNPAPPDPFQAMLFNWMPIIFTLMLASFPAGLIIYWTWNNFLSIIQQIVIMKFTGSKVELWHNLKTIIWSDSPPDNKKNT